MRGPFFGRGGGGGGGGEFQIRLFHVLRSRPIFMSFVPLSYVAVSRTCCLSEFYPIMASSCYCLFLKPISISI